MGRSSWCLHGDHDACHDDDCTCPCREHEEKRKAD